VSGDTGGSVPYCNRWTGEMGSRSWLVEETGIVDYDEVEVVSKPLSPTPQHRTGRIRIIALRRIGARRRSSAVGSRGVMAVLRVGRIARHSPYVLSRLGVSTEGNVERRSFCGIGLRRLCSWFL